MNNQEQDSPRQIVTDSLLSEHARLGRNDDTELVESILEATVRQSSPIELARPGKQQIPVADWFKLAAIVTAIASIGTLLLNSYRPGGQAAKPDHSRKESTFHVMVESIDSDRASQAARIDRKIYITTEPGPAELPLQVDHPTGPLNHPNLAEADYSAPLSQFEQSIDRLPDLQTTFTIAANEKLRNGDGREQYLGEVVLNHSEFVLVADTLTVDLPLLHATNARLKHKKGAYESEARSITFDPATNELVASGISRLLKDGTVQSVPSGSLVFEQDEIFVPQGYASPE